MAQTRSIADATLVEFFAEGIPVGQGSGRCIPRSNGAGCYYQHTGGERLFSWREIVSIRAKQHFEELLSGPVAVRINFYIARPKTVKREHPSVPPDLDKLARAVLDGLDGIAYADDAQVTQLVVRKRYADSPTDTGAWISVVNDEDEGRARKEGGEDRLAVHGESADASGGVDGEVL